MKPKIPAHLSNAEFGEICQKLRAIVGTECVFTEESDLAAYFDPYSPGMAESFTPSGAVTPQSVEEIQAILRVANDFELPLWTVSTGKNFVYGGAAPCLAGSMVLDLKRMNRIVEFNEDLAYAIVEPGVSYFDLYRYLRERKSRLWIDCASPGWGSVLANILERGLGYTQHADHAGNQCGMEVVLANGDLVRTGMGGMSGNPTWPLYKYSFGPSLDGIFMQSNLGVVTKIGVWLHPEPEVFSPVDIGVQSDSDIIALIDNLLPLRLDGTVSYATIRNWLRQASGRTTRAQWYQGKGAVPELVVDRIIRELRLSRWHMTCPLYGSEAVVAANYARINDVFSRIKGAKIARRTYRRGDKIHDGDALFAGIPSLNFQMLDWCGGAGAHIECPPVIPLIGKRFYDYYLEKTRLFSEHGFDHYSGVTTVSPRCAINTGSIIFDANDVEQGQHARDLGAALIDLAAKYGFAPYRSHISEMDLAAAKFDFNDHASMRVFETLKDALDPAGILSPGKQGVWPRSMRKGAARSGKN